MPSMPSSEITLTQRDLTCLAWIALQYAIRLDQLRQLLFRHTPEADRYKLKPGTDRLSLDRTYEIINRWLALKLIEKNTILQGDKLWIWLTRQGLRTVQMPFNYGSGAPSSITLPHLFAINQVRLAVEAKRPDDGWQTERQLRKDAPPLVRGETRPHTPDAILTNATNGKITAIEVERSAKNADELENDLRELAVTYKSIWYFATKKTRRQVETMLEEKFTQEMRKPFVFYDLGEYTHNEYKLS
jgi:hypothetical protein